jgi:pyruvate kinase
MPSWPMPAGVNVYQTFDFIRTFTPKPVPPVEAVCAALAKNAVDALPGAR